MGEAKRRREMLGEPMSYTDLATGEVQDGRYGGNPMEVFQNWLRRAPGDKANVPCKSCRECCYHGGVDVQPDQEPPERLEHLSIRQDDNGNWWLRKREDGACVHLGEEGCTVYKHRPNACRAYDCRIYAITTALDSFDNGHRQPVWLFDRRTPEARAFLATAQIMGMAEMARRQKAGEDYSAADVATAVLSSPKLLEGFRAGLQLTRLSPAELKDVLGFDPTDPKIQEEAAAHWRAVLGEIESGHTKAAATPKSPMSDF